jgi:hypothetical protein
VYVEVDRFMLKLTVLDVEQPFRNEEIFRTEGRKEGRKGYGGGILNMMVVVVFLAALFLTVVFFHSGGGGIFWW